MAVVRASSRPRHAWTRSTLVVVGVAVAVAALARAVVAVRGNPTAVKKSVSGTGVVQPR